MADIATRKESCNFSEFAGWLDVSRQLSITGGTTATWPTPRARLTSPLLSRCGNPSRGSQTSRMLLFLASAAGNGIQQDKLRVDLVFLQVLPQTEA